ncbi:MAG: efflux RND transporter periplasmic adaptor subunit [Desulfocapsaceae bacterium]|nr:efflux RND transporter periplasmic adaptor subunit [Desulfocapsaceae bacterium]
MEKTTYKVKLVALMGVLTGMLIMTGCKQQASMGGPPPAGTPEVGVITITTAPVTLTMELPGRTSPHMLAEVRPQVGGIILKRLFTEGSDVKAGQILYQIDPATYQAAHTSAKAALARAEANLTTVRLKADRFRELVAIKAVSQQEYDDVSALLKQVEADVAVSQAAVDTARINLDYTSVKAPISGRIGRSTVTDGALVTANQTAPMATIQQLNPVYVDVTQSSAELLRLKRNLANGEIKGKNEGQAKVKLLLEDGSAYPQEGTLKLSEVAVEQETGSVTLRALFPNPDQLLLSGMFVRAILEEGTKEDAILVPQRGVSRSPNGSAMVMVVGAEEKVEPRVIKVSQTVGDNWLVSDGLQAGDRVILEGIQKARPGTVVTAVPFGSKADTPATGNPQPAAAKK